MWSNRVEEAGWITDRSRPGRALPTGYEAYARLLHPIAPDDIRDEPVQVRWAQVAVWSGATLGPTTAFWQIALPEHLPAEPMPGGGAPASHVLGVHDGAVLARLLRDHTTTPQRCWFGIWDGYGWDSTGSHDPVPVQVRAGPRVRLPHRNYLLYTGAVEAGLAFLASQHEVADLWWPADRAWFVYGDVDLNCTYAGGSTTLVQELVKTTELEAIQVDPADPTAISSDAPDWLTTRIETVTQDLMTDGNAELSLSRFVVYFELGGYGRAVAETRSEWGLRYGQSRSPERMGWSSLNRTSDLRTQLRRDITIVVIDMVQE